MAREVSGFVKNPVGAFEEFGAPQMLLALLGLGVVGGGIYYVATKKPAAAVVQTAANSAFKAPIPSFDPTTVSRPSALFAASVPGTHVQVPASTGSILEIQSGQSLTLTLPTGGRWTKAAVGNATTQVSTTLVLGNDTVSAISIPVLSMAEAEYNVVVAAFTTASGASSGAMYEMQMMVGANKIPLT